MATFQFDHTLCFDHDSYLYGLSQRVRNKKYSINTISVFRYIKDTEEANKSVKNSDENLSRRKRYTRYYKICTKVQKIQL